MRQSVWRPVFNVFKYRNNKRLRSSNFARERAHVLQKLKLGKWNNTKWLREIRRKIGSFMLYKTYMRRGKIYSLHKRVKFTEFKNYLGIKNTNRIIGYTPDYIGPTVSKVVNARNFVTEFLSDQFFVLKDRLSIYCFEDLIKSANEERVVFTAGYTSSISHLKEYLKDNTTEHIWTVTKILKVLECSNFKWFSAAKVDFSDGNELFTAVKSNPDAYAGHYTSMLFGAKKMFSDFASRKIAYNIWDLIKTDPIKNRYLWKILGREKDIKIDTTTEKEVGTRVVLTCESPMTILLCWFAQRISYIVTNDFNWDCKFNIGGNFDSNKYKKLIDKSYDYDFALEADWTYYDSNIDTNFLLVAGLLICNGFSDNRHHRNIRYLIISSIVTKYIAIPPGVVVELNRAQPSGHPFGTLVNCYVNLIYWSIIGQRIYGDNYADYMDVEVYGDDTRAYFKDHPNLVNINDYVKECGLKSDDLLPNFRSINELNNPNKDIDFLKRRFDYNGIRWNHKKMFDKLIYQSKNRSLNDQFLLVKSWYESVPTDEDAKILLKEFSTYLFKYHKKDLNYDNTKAIYDILESRGDELKVNNNYAVSFTYNKKVNDHNYCMTRYSQTIFYKDNAAINIDDTFKIYADNMKVLALTGNVPYAGIKRSLIEIGVLGRDPPLIDYSSEMYLKFELLIRSQRRSFKKILDRF